MLLQMQSKILYSKSYTSWPNYSTGLVCWFNCFDAILFSKLGHRSKYTSHSIVTMGVNLASQERTNRINNNQPGKTTVLAAEKRASAFIDQLQPAVRGASVVASST